MKKSWKYYAIRDMWQEKTTNSYLQQRIQFHVGVQFSSLIKSNTFSSQEITLCPHEKQPKSSKTLFGPTITEKSKHVMLLQRPKPTVGREEIATVSEVAENQPDFVQARVLNS